MKRLAAFAITTVLCVAALPAAAQEHRTTGVVKSVNVEKRSASIAHGPVPSLNWPGMTMSFKVQDDATLAKLKPGARIEFSFVQSGRDYLITDAK